MSRHIEGSQSACTERMYGSGYGIRQASFTATGDIHPGHRAYGRKSSPPPVCLDNAGKTPPHILMYVLRARLLAQQQLFPGVFIPKPDSESRPH